MRFWPLLGMVRVPLVSVGALPQPAVAARAPFVAASAVAGSPPLSAPPTVAARRTAAAAMVGSRCLCFTIAWLLAMGLLSRW